MKKKLMKKKKLMLTLFASMAAMTMMAGDFKVSGSISGLADGTKLVLVPLSYAKEAPVATTTVQGGKFTLAGSVPAPMCVSLKVDESYGMIQMMVDNETATVNATANMTKAEDGAPLYTYSDIKITASPLTDKLNSLLSVRDSLDVLYTAYHTKYAKLFQAQDEAYAKKDNAELERLKNSEDYKNMAAEEKNFFDTVEKKYSNLISSNKDCYWGPLLMLNLFSYLTPAQRPIFEQFTAEAKNSYYGKKVYQELYPAGQTGQKVASFTVKDEAGKTHTLESLLQGKKYMVLDFWASWCAPCRKEIPNIKKQYALYKEKGLQVVSISIDKNAAAWKKAVKDEQLQWSNFLSPAVADEFHVKAIPCMYLIDSEGKIVAENEDARGEKLAAKLAELFK